MSDLDIMADSAAMTRGELNVLYSSSCWSRRMSPQLVVDHHCKLALTGLDCIQQAGMAYVADRG